MTDAALWLQLAASFAAGGLLGWLYFRGLRLTLDRIPGSAHPGTLLLLSFLVRAAAAVALFALIARFAHGHGLAAALLGFIGVRTAIVRRAKRDAPPARAPSPSPSPSDSKRGTP
jgi:F1F0 ATPase subunit 2